MVGAQRQNLPLGNVHRSLLHESLFKPQLMDPYNPAVITGSVHIYEVCGQPHMSRNAQTRISFRASIPCQGSWGCSKYCRSLKISKFHPCKQYIYTYSIIRLNSTPLTRYPRLASASPSGCLAHFSLLELGVKPVQRQRRCDQGL